MWCFQDKFLSVYTPKSCYMLRKIGGTNLLFERGLNNDDLVLLTFKNNLCGLKQVET